MEIDFDGHTWWQVGMRYKGNSSLHAAWSMGVKKLAFRLDFDQFEEDYPSLLDQRFFGFKKMTFSNGFSDPSLIRDKLAADIFREGGVPAARGAFARIYVDFGEGPVYFGLYTMIEDPSNKMIDTQFGDGSGKLYKPDGDGASWELPFQAEHFYPKTYEDEDDWSDIEGVMEILHDSLRESDPPRWREELEAVFDVQLFLRLLALNQTMVNWDSYGSMTHNYYLYADPSDGGRIKWFPWDLNEALMVKQGPGGGPPGGASGGTSGTATSVLLEEVSDGWPMIRYLLDDPTYTDFYAEQLEAGLEGAFAKERVLQKIDAYHELIAPYVEGVEGEEGESAPYSFLGAGDFGTSTETGQNALKPHVESRHEAVREAL